MSKPQSNYLFQWFDPDNNDFLVGGKVYTYIPGTTTDKATYSDATLTTANTNPITLDSYGSAIIYLSGPTKFVVKDADGVTIDTQDYVGTPGENWYNAAFYGTLGTQAALVAAIAALGSSNGTVYLGSGT